MKRFYLITRDLHLYFGLFISPFVLLFAISVIFLVHAWIPGMSKQQSSRTASGLSIPADLDLPKGREQLTAIRGVLDQLGVGGEVNFIRRVPKERRLVIPVIVPGRETTVDLDLETRSAVITERNNGAWEGLVYLHTMPGQHNAAMRGNVWFMRFWRWLADITVYLVLFISATGLYLWFTIKAERRIGWAVLGAGAVTFFGLLHGLAR